MQQEKEPKNKTFSDLIRDSIFEVPNYQRAYSWQKKQIDDLFSDIIKLTEKQDKFHFMATIACLERGEKEVGTNRYINYDIVDGQQRITSLIILLKCISEFLKNGNQEEQKWSKDINDLIVKGNGNITVLKSNHDVNNFFSEFLHKGVDPITANITLESEKRISFAIKRCKQFIKKWVEEGHSVIDLFKDVAHKIYFVFQSLSDESSVYRVFEVLNSRGLTVDWLDKTKSMLMGLIFDILESDNQALEETMGKLHKIWSNIYKDIGYRNIPGDEIIKFAATFKDDNQTAKTLSPEDSIEFFQKYCDSPQMVIEMSNFIHKIVSALRELYDNKKLEAVTKISHVRFLYLAIIFRNDLDEKYKNKCLDQWERVSFRIHGIAGKDSRYEVGNFTKLAQYIHHRIKLDKDRTIPFSKNDIFNELKELGKEYPINEIIKEIKEKDLYNAINWKTELRYFFQKYEEYLSSKKGIVIDNKLWMKIWDSDVSDTIEHICPQSYNYEWRTTTDICEEDINRLGNLTLLPSKTNSEAQARPFVEKKVIYRNYSSLLINEDLLKKRKWNKAAIIEREKKLLEFAEEAWSDIS